MGNLRGMHIIITRPPAQAKAWAQQLEAEGAVVSFLALMEIVPLEDEVGLRAIKNRILDFDHYSKAIFVSQNAVEQGIAWLENYWPQLPQGVDFFAVGETTAKLLQSYGVNVTDLAQTQTGAMTSETLLQAPRLQQVAGEKILIFRGRGGRTHLGESLAARGAKVDYCELYERCLPQQALSQAEALFCGREQSAPVNNLIVSLHSGEAFANLLEVLEQIGCDIPDLKQQLGLLVPSDRVAEQAAAAGFKKIYTAHNATDVCMLQRLMNIQIT